MNSNEIDIHKELKKYFGFSQFKGLQEQVIKSILNQQNTFVIMPTGGGKSLCYQLPALVSGGIQGVNLKDPAVLAKFRVDIYMPKFDFAMDPPSLITKIRGFMQQQTS